MSKDFRKYCRVILPGMVHLSWQDANGSQKFVRGRCVDLSLSGIRVETPESIPLRSYVAVRLESMAVTTTASVRHTVRSGGKYWIGLEFSCPLKTLADRLNAQADRMAMTSSSEPL